MEEAEDFQCGYVIYCLFNRNRSALVCDLLSYNSLFVSHLYEDNSLVMHACDFIFFTTDLQTVNYNSTNHYFYSIENSVTNTEVHRLQAR